MKKTPFSQFETFKDKKKNPHDAKMFLHSLIFNTRTIYVVDFLSTEGIINLKIYQEKCLKFAFMPHHMNDGV